MMKIINNQRLRLLKKRNKKVKLNVKKTLFLYKIINRDQIKYNKNKMNKFLKYKKIQKFYLNQHRLMGNVRQKRNKKLIIIKNNLILQLQRDRLIFQKQISKIL